MLFVCISHFGIAYLDPSGDKRDGHLVSLLALPSTPTFVVLSGLLLGFLHVRSAATFPELGLKLMDRGLFLLLPTHALISIAHFVIFGTVRFIYITDAIGVCILLGPWLVSTFSARSRLISGLAIIAFSWSVYLTWMPSSSWSRWLHSVFIGDFPFKNGWLTFPLLPWLGCYVLATPLGELLARWRQTGEHFVARLAGISISAISVGLALHVIGRHFGPGVRGLLSAGQKYPPSPVFLLTSGGTGLAVTTLVAWIEERQLLPGGLAILAVVGRSSLVVFIVQYFVYYVAVYSLHLSFSHLWPAYLTVSVLFIFGVAYVWDRYIGNDCLTVGFSHLMRDRIRKVPSLG